MNGRTKTPSGFGAKLTVERLEARDVPSSTVVNLTAAHASGSVNEALFQQTDAQPTGTGKIRSFVRLQPGGAGTHEQGYNTDARPLQFDENTSPQFTRSQLLNAVPLVSVNGVNYRQFLLDINQKSSSPLLSLDELRVYTAGTANLSGYDAASKTLGGQSALYDLDAGGDSSVTLNARLNSGSGAGDMFLLVPDANFVASPAGSNVYLYSKFGDANGANGGFEEWAVKVNNPSGPTPTGTGSISGTIFDDSNGNGVLDSGETLLGGATVQIQGTDYLGNTVILTATTDANGFYKFSNLAAGTYTITEVTPPPGYSVSNNTYNYHSDIVVGAGWDITNINFADVASNPT